MAAAIMKTTTTRIVYRIPFMKGLLAGRKVGSGARDVH